MSEIVGIRGAICAHGNTREEIAGATRYLLRAIVERNDLEISDIRAAFFTMTPDLDAEFPASAAREIGWSSVPMLGAQETQVPGGVERAIRTLILAKSPRPPEHVYLGAAAAMRPDLAKAGDAELWDERPSGRSGSSPRAGRLLIVGLGLIGGSLGAAVLRNGRYTEVCGHDLDEDVARRAVELGLVERVVDDLETGLADADLVVLAVPVREIGALFPRIGRAVRPGAVITDVGSTKRAIVEAMDALPEDVRAVGGHPMAGTESSGPEAADPALFEDATWALVRTSRTDAEAWQRVVELVRAAGGRPAEVSAEAHDRLVSVTSHLPVALALALIESAVDLGVGANGPHLWGPGFRGSSRLAAGDPEMTSQMLAANADHLTVAIDAAVNALQRCREELSGDSSELRERLAAAARARDRLIEE